MAAMDGVIGVPLPFAGVSSLADFIVSGELVRKGPGAAQVIDRLRKTLLKAW